MRLGKAHWTTFGEDKALFECTPFTLYDYDHIGFFFLFFFLDYDVFFWGKCTNPVSISLGHCVLTY